MSDWIKVKSEDIEFDGDDINIYFESDEFGNRYIEISYKEFIKALKNMGFVEEVIKRQ